MSEVSAQAQEYVQVRLGRQELRVRWRVTVTPDASDARYRITAAARLRLKRGIDPDALERLLQHFPAESRASHLEMFSVHRVVADADGRIPDVAVLTRISNPVLQQMLEEVWQPYWDEFSDVELEEISGGPPGLELARRRRAEGRSR